MIKVDGKVIAQKIINELKQKPAPKKILAAVFVGMNPASESFLKIKEKTAQELGVNFQVFQLAEVVGQDEIEDKVRGLSRREDVGGIIVQLPLPRRFDREKILSLIDPKKDVDALGVNALVEAPVVGVVKEVLASVGWELTGKKIAIVGKGRLVGQPIIKWLKNEQAVSKHQSFKFKAADEETKNLPGFLAEADLVISGVGKKEGGLTRCYNFASSAESRREQSCSTGLIKPEWLKEGAGVIDFGFPPDFDSSACDLPSAICDKLSFYTPTPGGTGPILVAKLFENFYKLNS